MLDDGTIMKQLFSRVSYVPDHAMSYEVNGLAAAQNAALLNREMQAVIASFHVEKVTPASGKRRGSRWPD